MASPRRYLALALFTVPLFGFDLWTKEAAVSWVDQHGPLVLIEGWFTVVHAENPGAAFSTPIPFGVIVGTALIGAVFVVRWLRDQPERARGATLAAALVLGGAMGNLVDRLPDGTVTDFLSVAVGEPSWAAALQQHFGTARWPVFNVADVWIVVGALWIGLMRRERSSAPLGGDGDPALTVK